MMVTHQINKGDGMWQITQNGIPVAWRKRWWQAVFLVMRMHGNGFRIHWTTNLPWVGSDT